MHSRYIPIEADPVVATDANHNGRIIVWDLCVPSTDDQRDGPLQQGGDLQPAVQQRLLYSLASADICVALCLHSSPTQNVAPPQCRRHKPDTYGGSNTVIPANGAPILHNTIETPLALLAGLLTIASPCILPVMPILLGTSVERPSRIRPLFIVAGFILTFASFAMLLGAVSSTVHVAQQVLRNTGIALLALSGLLRVWPGPYDWLVARLQPPLQRIGAAVAPGVQAGIQPGIQPGSGNAGGFVLGMSLGAVWTPCAGPVLASILVLVVKAQDLGWSALLLTLYAIGAAIPMLAIIYGGHYMTQRVRIVARHAERLQQVFGVLVILTALAIYLQVDVLAYSRIASIFPSLKGL